MNRDDLKDYRFLKVRINNKLNEYEEQYAKVTKITQNIDGMPKGKNKPNYVLEEFLDSSNEIIQLMNEDVKKQKNIIKQLRIMDNEKYYTALYLRYIVFALEDNALEKTAEQMNYSYNEMCKINGEALNEFDKFETA